MPAIQATLGFVISLLGRQVYPVFVGGVGFVATAFFMTHLRPFESEWGMMTLSILVGFFTALATFLVKRFAAWIAAFAAGVYLLYSLPPVFGGNLERVSYWYAALAGAFCVALVMAWFEGGMVFLAALTGAVMMIQAINFGAISPVVMFLVLLVFSLAAQYVLMQYGTPSPD